MDTDPIRVCELIVGLPDVNVLGVEEFGADAPLRPHIETRGPRPACEGCGTSAEVKDRPRVELSDLPAFGRSVRTVWHKHRWRCPMTPGAMDHLGLVRQTSSVIAATSEAVAIGDLRVRAGVSTTHLAQRFKELIESWNGKS